MNTVPKITDEHVTQAIVSYREKGFYSIADICNKANEIALAEQQEITAFAKKRSGMEFDEWQGRPPQQESEYITAEQARELGAGNVIFRVIGGTHWYICDKHCNFPEIGYQYRAIKQHEPLSINFIQAVPEQCDRIIWRGNYYHLPLKGLTPQEQPEPVEPHAELKAMYEQQVKDGTLHRFVWECKSSGSSNFETLITPVWFSLPDAEYRCTPKPTCQVRNEDAGELKTMTRRCQETEQAMKLAKFGAMVIDSQEFITELGVKAGLMEVNPAAGGYRYTISQSEIKEILND